MISSPLAAPRIVGRESEVAFVLGLLDAALTRGPASAVLIAGEAGIDDVRALIARAGAESLNAALALAANHGHVEVVAFLLDAGADVNRFSPVGAHSPATPLHQAVASGKENIARLLVERGADPTIKDIRYNGTPLEWAQYLGHATIAEYLREL